MKVPRLAGCRGIGEALVRFAFDFYEKLGFVPYRDRDTMPPRRYGVRKAMLVFGADTHSEAAKVQLRLLRMSSVARRAGLALSLSATSINLSRHALRARMPSATAAELNERWRCVCYGAELAGRVRRYIGG